MGYKILSPTRLSRVNVKCINEQRALLHCLKCGFNWTPNFQEGGRLHRHWWWCPNGCNSHIKNINNPENK